MRKVSTILLYFGLLLFVCISCKEDIGLIGLDVQPEEEFINTDYLVVDSTNILAYSTLHDSLITSNVSVNLIGYLDDPVFGETQAGIYTDFRLSSTAATFGTGIVVDSLVLTLVYSGYYGDTLNAFRLRAYELQENLTKSQNYYSISSLAHDNNNLTEDNNLYVSPRPETKQDTAATAYYLRIKLSKTFAEDRFINAPPSVYANDAAFLNYFKGLYLEADAKTGNGCIVSLNMIHTLSALTMYYSNSQATNQKFIFNLNDSSAHFSHINHFGYTKAAANLQQQLNGNHTSASEILYGQAGAGIKVVLGFPSLKDRFKDKKVVIHRASLVINCIEDASPHYFSPAALAITYTDPATGVGMLLPDYYLGSDYLGGIYNQTTKEYRFRITQYIQKLVDGSGDNYPLNILVSPSATRLTRLMMYGTYPRGAYDKRLRLEIYYTIINK